MQPTSRVVRFQLLAILLVAACGLVYELLITTAASYLLGNTVLQYSLGIGIFIGSMGIGSWFSKFVEAPIEAAFLKFQLALATLGALSTLVVHWAFWSSATPSLIVYLLIAVVGALTGFELPLLMRMLKEKAEFNRLIASALALDNIGCLIASLVFPLILLPHLGLIRTAMATGALNLAVVAFGLYYFDLKPKIRLQLTLVTALLTILLGVGLWQATWIGDMMENRLYQDGIVYSDQSPYQKIVMTNHKRDLRLFLNGQLQFSSVDEHRYHESLVHPAFGLHRSPKRVLVLGAGDGLATREILRYPSVEEIILCDLDEKVSNLAKNFSPLTKLNQNSLHDPRVRIVHQDAFSYLFEDQDPFDVILADLPDPSTPLLAKLYSREFYRRIMALLKKDGIFATQATSPFTAPEAYHTIVSTIRATGLRARPYRTFIPSFGEWGFVLASPQPLNLQNWKPIADLRFLNPDLFPSLFTWSSDSLSPEPTIVSTLDNISVTFAYQKALEREL